MFADCYDRENDLVQQKPRMQSLRFLPAVLAIATCAGAAEPPAIQGLFPSGVQTGQTTRVDLVGKPGDLPLQLWSSRPELTGQIAEDGKWLRLTAAPNAPAGICWLRLFNAAGANRLRPFIVGTLPEVTEVEPNNAAADAQVIDITGTVVNGVLDRRDKVDMFLVPLAAGQTLVASLDADRTLGSPMDGILQLVSPRGFVVQQNDDDHGIDPQLVFTATEPGEYAVRLFSFPKDPNSTIRYAGGDDYLYRLTITTGPFVDRVTPTTSDATGPFELLGWNIPQGQTVTPIRADHGLTASLALLGSWEFERLGFVPDAVQREIDPAAATNPVLIPGATWGSIEQPGDRDEYSFQGIMGTKYTFAVTARGAGSPLDAVLTIRDSAGTVLQEADDAAGEKFDPAITFTPSADGEYRIEVTDRFEFGGPRFFYVLAATPERPDFTLELEQDAYVVQVGTPLEVALKVVRAGGMAADVTLVVENLPAGVTATMTTPAPDANGNFVVPNGTEAATLKLEAAEGTTYSGPLSIAATSGPDAQRRAAIAPLVQQPLRTPHIWLTVTPKP
jgi:hypothetical protein